MNKILSAVVATLVAMSFTSVAFAANVEKPIVIANPAAVSTSAGDAQKDAKTMKAEAKLAKAKEDAEAKEAKAKAKAEAKAAKAKVKADAKAAKAKAKADAKAEKESVPATK
jgi:Skp family chaperone for outer membrane proteins